MVEIKDMGAEKEVNGAEDPPRPVDKKRTRKGQRREKLQRTGVVVNVKNENERPAAARLLVEINVLPTGWWGGDKKKLKKKKNES